MAQATSSGRVLRRAIEQPADGILSAGADRARCPGAWGGGVVRGHKRKRLGLHAGRATKRRSDGATKGGKIRAIDMGHEQPCSATWISADQRVSRTACQSD